MELLGEMVPLAVGGCTVELYWMDTNVLKDMVQFAQAYQSLSRGRQRKADSFLLMKYKKLSLCAGYCLLQAVDLEGEFCEGSGHSSEDIEILMKKVFLNGLIRVF